MRRLGWARAELRRGKEPADKRKDEYPTRYVPKDATRLSDGAWGSRRIADTLKSRNGRGPSAVIAPGQHDWWLVLVYIIVY